MFGYIKTDKGELKVKEYELYRGLYCSLCKALSKRYGVLSRLILSYDMTFLVLVRLSQKGLSPSFKAGHCPFNPAKKCNYCTNAESEYDYVCAVAVLMFYYKIKDNIKDSAVFKKLLFYFLLPLAARWKRKATKLFPQLEAIISNAIDEQEKTEKQKTASPDMAAHNSAAALGKIFSFGFDEKEQELYRFGYFVGRWVYLLDALDDIESDIKHKSYNVFINKYSLEKFELTPDIEHEIVATLNQSSAEAIKAFKSTGCGLLGEIIENILYGGMQIAVENVLKGKRSNERSI